MSQVRTTHNEHGTFHVRRESASAGMVCDRCLEPKVTKVVVEWTTPQGLRKQLCNGCYGWLTSGKPL